MVRRLDAIRRDLAQLEANGLMSFGWNHDQPINLGDQDQSEGSAISKIHPARGDSLVFRRALTLLGHSLKDRSMPRTAMNSKLVSV